MCYHLKNEDVPMRIIKRNIDVFDVLVYICNLSLCTGIFPKALMVALITCLFKSGKVNCFENYRAISILVACSKVIEKIVTVQLVHYFKHNNYFTPFQFGYRQGYSTVDAVLTILNHIFDSFDVRETTIGVFLDLSKAFDTLNRNILFEKLKYYGINGIELQWFKSYFSEKSNVLDIKIRNLKCWLQSKGSPREAYWDRFFTLFT